MQEQQFNLTDLNIPGFFHQNDESLKNLPLKAETLALLQQRDQLRKFLAAAGHRQPDFAKSSEFTGISAWAVKRNQFPVLLKTTANQANNRNGFLLKAFRELPVFFEEIQDQHPILIESFFPAKARLEATFFNGKLVLVAQIGMEKSLRYLPAWRAFPVSPPPRCLKEIQKTAELFADLLNLKNLPVRLSFAFNPEQTTALSINLGFNRHEYFPEYGDYLGRPQVFTEKTGELNKILFYRLKPEQLADLDAKEIAELLRTTIKKIDVGETTVILLRSPDPTLLLDDSKKADSFFNHLSNEEIKPAVED